MFDLRKLNRRWPSSPLAATTAILALALTVSVVFSWPHGQQVEQLEEGERREHTYLPVVIDQQFETIRQEDLAAKEEFQARQQRLLEERYDLSDRPSPVMMSGGRKAVQQGVRVKLPEGVTWQQLSEMSPEEIKQRDLFPKGFRPLLTCPQFLVQGL